MMPARLHRFTEARHIMKRRRFYPKHPITPVAVCVAGLLVIGGTSLQAKEIQVGRYSTTTTAPTPAQAELLSTTVTLRFPERIQTVGEAVRYLLQRSGYRVADPERVSSETMALFALPLPAVHRSLGPIALREALQTLAGPAFILVQDPVHRLLTFERCAGTDVSGRELRTVLDEGGAKDEH